MTFDPSARPAVPVDFELIFNLTSGMCLVLDPGFTILAQNEEHARATLSVGKQVVGRNLFAVFFGQSQSLLRQWGLHGAQLAAQGAEDVQARCDAGDPL
jgi:hypothetical protein